MKDSKSTKILRIILDIVCILLVIVSMIRGWVLYLENGWLFDMDIAQNIMLLTPFCLCWTFAQLTSIWFVREILEIFAFLLAIAYALLALSSFSFGVSFGFYFMIETLLFLSIFPLMAILFFIERKNYENARKRNDLDHILDAGIDFEK